MQKQKNNHLMFYLGILILLAFIIVFVQKGGVVGKIVYDQPLQVYGKVIPNLLDGTKISFKIDDLEIASAEIKDNKYGYEPEVFLKTDDPLTSEKEGYSKGDTVTVYIEDVRIATLSYFGNPEKFFYTSIDQRTEILNRVHERKTLE